VDEIIKQDRWKDTIEIMMSEFGLSLLSNSIGGCDHAGEEIIGSPGGKLQVEKI